MPIPSVQVTFGCSRQRLTLRKAGVNRMPGDDCRFAKLPAEKDHSVILDLPGEINQSLVDVFKQAPIGFDLFRGFRYLLGRFAQIRVALDYLWQMKLPGCRVQFYQFADTPPQVAGPVLKFADSNFEPRYQLIRLSG